MKPLTAPPLDGDRVQEESDESLAEEAPAEPTSVKVQLRSFPDGATVWLDGEEVGTTPLDTEVPFGEERVGVRLEVAGRPTLDDSFIPDMDQRLRFAFPPPQRTKSSRGSGMGMAPTPQPSEPPVTEMSPFSAWD